MLPYLRPYWKLAVASTGMIGLGTLVGLLAPWPFAIVVDSVLGNKPLPGPLGFLEGLNQYELLAVAVVGGLLLTATATGSPSPRST